MIDYDKLKTAFYLRGNCHEPLIFKNIDELITYLRELNND